MNVQFWCKDELNISAFQKLVSTVNDFTAGVNPSKSTEDLIINWGCTDFEYTESEHTWIMNRPVALRKLEQSDAWMIRLERHGLRCVRRMTNRTKLVKLFTIPVFHLKALAVFQHQTGAMYSHPQVHVVSTFEEVNQTSNQRFRYLSRKAIRAIYALGLDFGLVQLGLNDQGKAVIVKVDPAPKLTSQLSNLYAEAIQEHVEMMSGTSASRALEGSLLVGMDPECILVNPDGKVVPADRFFEKKGRVGSDSIVLEGRAVVYPLLEFRPQPAASPDILLSHLEQLMHSAHQKLQKHGDFQWLAGGSPRRGIKLGGHLHFSGRPLDSRWLRALDYYLALPLVMLEDSSTSGRRPKYGFLGDHRTKHHGGFEYRALPSWIVDRDLTHSVVCLAFIIAQEYRVLQSDMLLDLTLIEAYYKGDKYTLRIYTQQIWMRIEQLKGYEMYRHQLRKFKDRLFHQQSWNEQRDLRESWGICNLQK